MINNEERNRFSHLFMWHCRFITSRCPLELEGNTYVGDEARKKGMQIVDLIRVLDVYFKSK